MRRRLLLIVASAILLGSPASALDVAPPLASPLVPLPLTATEALALATPTLDPRMDGYLQLAAQTIASADVRAHWTAVLEPLIAGHGSAVAHLHGQDLPARQGLDMWEPMSLVTTPPLSGDATVGSAIDHLRAHPLVPAHDDLWQRLQAAATSGAALVQAPSTTTTHAMDEAARTLHLLDAPFTLDAERDRLAEVLAPYHGAQAAVTVTDQIAALLTLQPFTPPAPPGPPATDDPAAAARALYAFVGLVPTDEQEARLQGLAVLDAASRQVLARFIHAHQVQLLWTQQALSSAPPDIDRLLAARALVATEAASMTLASIPCVPGLSDNTSTVFSYDLACQDSRYDSDARLVFDLGGDDLYRNNAGGTGPIDQPITAALLADVRGNDTYQALDTWRGAYIGSSHGGSGVLIDGAGDDRYEAVSHVVEGQPPMGAFIGSAAGIDASATGLLIDISGDDRYTALVRDTSSANGGAIGPAHSAAALLLDLAGRDVYQAQLENWSPWVPEGELAANGGAIGRYTAIQPNDPERRSRGGLVDLGGDDDHYAVLANGTLAANGGASDTASALLLDGGGNDTYSGTATAVQRRHAAAINGAGLGGQFLPVALTPELESGPAFAAGSLIDIGSGDDHYNGTIAGNIGPAGAINGAAWLRGSGLLLDEGGTDRYLGTIEAADGWSAPVRGAVNGAGADGGVGVLLDAAGADHYEGTLRGGDQGFGETAHGAVNGAACGESSAQGHPDRCSVAGSPAPAVGVLLDLGTADDTYYATITAGVVGENRTAVFGAGNGAAYDGHALLLDAGGDDVYRGGLLDGSPGAWAQPVPHGRGALNGAVLHEGAAMLIDGGGADTYDALFGSGGANGAGVAGLVVETDQQPLTDPVHVAVGVLLDASGDDTYTALFFAGAANGGGEGGAGLLVDDAGHDRYDGELVETGGLNGGAGKQGIGVLIDSAGHDVYAARSHAEGGLNGAANGFTTSGHTSASAALLLDRGGHDTYNGLIRGEHPGGVAFGFTNGAANGAAQSGTGLLIDDDGDDTYTAYINGSGVANGAGMGGIGLLSDSRGNDRYNATLHVPFAGTWGGLNGGALVGVGVLRDGGGDDTYEARLGIEGGSWSGLSFGGANGGALVGLGALLDAAGTNSFMAAIGGYGGSHGGAGGFLPSLPPQLEVLLENLPVQPPNAVGVLVGGTGDDTYITESTAQGSLAVTQGAADAYGLGVLIEPDGHDRYTAGPIALAQGAALNGGTGLLGDLGGSGSFTLLADSFGQGYAQQGAGTLVQADHSGVAHFSVDVTAHIATSTGAGIGLRLAAGLGTGDLVEPTCTTYEMKRIDDNTGLRSVVACAPDPNGRVYVLDPTTGEPMNDLPKPVVPCGDPAVPIIGPLCGSTVEQALGEDADDWLRQSTVSPSTSGGVVVVTAGDATDPVGTVKSLYNFNMIDESCAYSCTTLSGLFPADQ